MYFVPETSFLRTTVLEAPLLNTFTYWIFLVVDAVGVDTMTVVVAIEIIPKESVGLVTVELIISV